MFDCEAGLAQYSKKHGRREAVQLVADINQYTKLHLPKGAGDDQAVKPSLQTDRTLFDYNEHFIEMSNMGEEDRSLDFMLLGLMFGLLPLLPLFGFGIGVAEDIRTGHWLGDVVFFGVLLFGILTLDYFLWPLFVAPHFFTSLRARYRFNRTTGKVYALRPQKYGGNVVLDWSRVQAHVNWCAPRELKYEDLRYAHARQQRQANGGGPFGMRGLVLYWPPLDINDPERKGEEVLWVGPKLAGEPLWQYIRTFMEEGMDTVPVPKECEWLRKGFSSVGEYIREGTSNNNAVSALESVWVPFHCLAERLCYWPTFPEEWNSDCGQRRRESGLGPQEPLRWVAKG